MDKKTFCMSIKLTQEYFRPYIFPELCGHLQNIKGIGELDGDKQYSPIPFNITCFELAGQFVVVIREIKDIGYIENRFVSKSIKWKRLPRAVMDALLYVKTSHAKWAEKLTDLILADTGEALYQEDLIDRALCWDLVESLYLIQTKHPNKLKYFRDLKPHRPLKKLKTYKGSECMSLVNKVMFLKNDADEGNGLIECSRGSIQPYSEYW